MNSQRTQASYFALFKLSHMHMEKRKAKWNQKVGEREPYASKQLGNSLVISPVPCYTDRSNPGELSHSVMAGMENVTWSLDSQEKALFSLLPHGASLDSYFGS